MNPASSPPAPGPAGAAAAPAPQPGGNGTGSIWPARPAAQAGVAARYWGPLPVPLWVLDPARALLFANAAARELESRNEAGSVAGRLMRLGSLDALALEGLLRPRQAGVPQQAALWFGDSARTGWAQAMPLAASCRDADWPAEALLLSLQIDQPELTQRARIDALCARERLSPAQRSVLLLLADGMGPEAVAQQLGVHLSTVRSHVRALLFKSRARSLAQLLSWLGGVGRSAAEQALSPWPRR